MSKISVMTGSVAGFLVPGASYHNGPPNKNYDTKKVAIICLISFYLV